MQSLTNYLQEGILDDDFLDKADDAAERQIEFENFCKAITKDLRKTICNVSDDISCFNDNPDRGRSPWDTPYHTKEVVIYYKWFEDWVDEDTGDVKSLLHIDLYLYYGDFYPGNGDVTYSLLPVYIRIDPRYGVVIEPQRTVVTNVKRNDNYHKYILVKKSQPQTTLEKYDSAGVKKCLSEIAKTVKNFFSLESTYDKYFDKYNTKYPAK